MKPHRQRQANYRSNRLKAGMRRVEIWVYQLDVERIRRMARRMNEARISKEVKL